MRLFSDTAARHTGWAMAVLHWPPDVAWQATPRDIFSAHDAWLQLNGFSADSACSTGTLHSLLVSFPDG